MVNTKQILSLGWQLIGLTPPGKAVLPVAPVAAKGEQGAARQITVSVVVPDRADLPETVTLSAPVVALETLVKIASVTSFLGNLYPDASESLRARASAFALCHHDCTYQGDKAVYSVMYSLSMLYLHYGMQHPEIFERINQAYNTAFDEEVKQIVALVREKIAQDTKTLFPEGQEGQKVN